MTPEEDLREILSLLKGSLEGYHALGLDMSFVPRVPSPRPPGEDMPLPAQEDRAEGLRRLEERIAGCTRCRLSRSRTRLVFGEGDPHARLVFVGEGPGEEEDKEGRPFVGPAGRLLTQIIEKGMGLRRGDVYICNVVKCRPPENRAPEPDEMAACSPFLREQISVLHPDVLCALGRVAGQGLLGHQISVTRDRGTWYDWQGIPVMLTFHPAYCLRNPQAKRPVWEDIKQIMGRLGMEVPARG